MIVNWLINLLEQNSLLSIFLGGLIEEIIIPIPSPLVSISAGALFVKERKLLLALQTILVKVSLPYSLGATIGSTFAYSITYFGGKLLVDKLENYLGFSWKLIEKVKEKYLKGSGDEITLLILRSVPIIPVSLISAVSGVIRYNLKSFYFYTFFGLIIRSFILAIIGWQTGQAYQQIWIEGLDKIQSIISILMILILLSFLTWIYFKRGKILKRINS